MKKIYVIMFKLLTLIAISWERSKRDYYLSSYTVILERDFDFTVRVNTK